MLVYPKHRVSITYHGPPEAFSGIDEKLISPSKKEMENFIRAKFEDYNPGRASQKALRTVPPIRSQGTVT